MPKASHRLSKEMDSCFQSGTGRSGPGHTHLSDGTVTHPDHVEESWHHLGQELHTLQSKRFENKGDGLNYHSVVLGQGLVSENSHQCHHRDSWIELIQREVAHVHQHLTGAVVS